MNENQAFHVLEALYRNRKRELTRHQLHELVKDHIIWDDLIVFLSKYHAFLDQDKYDDNILQISKIGINQYKKLRKERKWRLTNRNSTIIVALTVLLTAALTIYNTFKQGKMTSNFDDEIGIIKKQIEDQQSTIDSLISIHNLDTLSMMNQ